MGDDDDYWNSSNAKGFSWDDASDTVSLPSTYSNSIVSNTSGTKSGADIVSFDSGVSSNTNSRLSERAREAARMISSAAELPEPSISQLVGVRDINSLETELKLVRRNFAKLQNDRFKPNSVVQTVQDMIVGRPFSLDGFKSLKEKEHLLDTALEWGDGDVVLAVTYMLKNTLKRSKFLSIMSSRQEAADHLISDLVVRHQLTEVVDLLLSLDRAHQAGTVAYKQAVNTNNLQVKSRNLRQLLNNSVRNHLDTDIIIEQCNLCERLNPVIASEVGNVERNPTSLNTASVLRSLQYLATHHYSTPENLLQSPEALRKMHGLTEKQYSWVCLRARAGLENWQDCLDLVVGKNWLGNKKAKGGVRPSQVTVVLAQAGAPPDVLMVLLGLVETNEERLETAKKVGLASVVVDVLVAMKDRQGLLQHKASLVASSEDWLYAENALKNSVKWKN